MSIKISITKNEFPFYPDVFDNLKAPVNEQLHFLLRKKSKVLDGGEWTTKEKGKDAEVDLIEFMRVHIIEMINPFTLEIDGKESVMTLEQLLEGKIPELLDLREKLFIAIGELDDKSLDIKK